MEEEGGDFELGDGVYAGVLLLPCEELRILEAIDKLIELEQGNDLLLL